MELEYNNDLLFKNNPADLVLLITVVGYDNIEKQVTILFDSNDDWSRITNSENKLSILPVFASIVLHAVTMDSLAKYFYAEIFQIVKGEAKEIMKLRPFIRDGKRFRKAIINTDGTLKYDPNDEIN